MGGYKIRFAGRNSHLKAAEYSLEDEESIYDCVLEDVYRNPAWYLDQLNYLREFKVRWMDYRSKRPVLPYKYVRKEVKNSKKTKAL